MTSTSARAADVDAVIRRLAAAALATRALRTSGTAMQMGRITLLAHQQAAVHWLERRLARYGGALLADPPGLGKTYVALAIAHRRNTTPLVIAPAALRTRWKRATDETGVPVDFISTERLSAPADVPLAPHELVIIDEAHHLRTPHTRRHQRTTAACANARVLLLSATPVHNTADDLEHLTALFHLPAARTSIRTLRRQLTLRRSLAEVLGAGALHGVSIPTVRACRAPRLPLRHAHLPDAILRLPPLPLPHDHDAHPLILLGCLHALRSSDAAARQRIRARIAATLAIEQAALDGVTPDATLRRAWQLVDDDIQLAMPLMLGGAAGAPDHALAHAAATQRSALEQLLPALDGGGDALRARVLRRLARWCAHPVVAFTWSTATAAALYAHLRHIPGVALLTGSGGHIASGSIPRDALLRQLLQTAEASHDGSPVQETSQRRDAVRLLITTDVLSEGLSLAGVGTVVHLDMPWTPARLDQRTGRAARIGAPVREVRTLTLEAPLPAHAHSAMRALLATKRQAMHHLDADREDEGDGVRTLVHLLQRGAAAAARAPVAGAARRWRAWWRCCSAPGAAPARTIALVALHGRRQLVVLEAGRVRRVRSADWALVVRASPQAGSAELRAARGELRRALQQCLADRELRAPLRMQRDHRLAMRRQADEMLASAASQQRHADAPGITGTRIQLTRLSRPADVRAVQQAVAASGGRVVPSREAGDVALRRRGAPPPAVRLMAGLVLTCDTGASDGPGYIPPQ